MWISVLCTLPICEKRFEKITVILVQRFILLAKEVLKLIINGFLGAKNIIALGN